MGALREHGNDCLPLMLVDGQVASRGTYPDRSELARLVGLDAHSWKGSPAKTASSSCCSSPGVVTIGGLEAPFV